MVVLLQQLPPSLLLFPDVSQIGPGVCLQELTTAGARLDSKQNKHTNTLEIK